MYIRSEAISAVCCVGPEEVWCGGKELCDNGLLFVVISSTLQKQLEARGGENRDAAKRAVLLADQFTSQ